MKQPEQSKSWRDVIKVHPAADLFPLMTTDELKALGEDIKKNGLAVPVILWQAEKGAPLMLLDGRNRLDAMEAAGLPVLHQLGKHLDWVVVGGLAEGDPYKFALSANIHRRHLTPDQKRDLIAAVLKAQPEKSDRQIAKQTKVDHKTVGAVRDKLEATGEIPQLDKTVGADGKARTTAPAQKPPAKKRRDIEVTSNRYFAEPDTRPPGDPAKYDEVAEQRATFDQFQVFLKVFAALEARGPADKVAEAILLLDATDFAPRLLRVCMFTSQVVKFMDSKSKSPNAAAAGAGAGGAS